LSNFLIRFFQQLAWLLQSGVSLSESLSLMARALELEDKKNINIKNIKILEQEFLLTLKEQLDFGVGFSAALKNSQNKKFKLIKLTGY